MNSLSIKPKHLPDIAVSTTSSIASRLDWVGMSGIALHFRLQEARRGELQLQGNADIHVDIARPEVKGIHMSRLYLLLEQLAESAPLSPRRLSRFLWQQLDTHRDISQAAGLSIQFPYLSRRPALTSDHSGWKEYPAAIHASLQDDLLIELELAIPYSSTCPCSASLSRQLLVDALDSDFSGSARMTLDEVRQWLLENGSLATPHSQRSWAKLKLSIYENSEAFEIEALIEAVESALGTPVQTAVKREDEQAFARLNGSNLMFCEDAARRVSQALRMRDEIKDFWIRVEHQESLHAHDAVAVVTAGLPGGYQALLRR